MNAWEFIKRMPEMNVIESTWAFKIKLYPDVLMKKLKTHFCTRGVVQIKGMYFFETHAPVMQCTTVCLVLILEDFLGLKSNQCDVMVAFLNTDFYEGKGIFVRRSCGYKQDGRVFMLKRTLYGLRQSSWPVENIWLKNWRFVERINQNWMNWNN